MNLERKINALKEIGRPIIFIRKAVPFGPLPMDYIRVAQQIDVITLTQREQQLQLLCRNIAQHRNPRSIDGLIGQLLFRQLPDSVTKLGRRDRPQLQLRE